MDLGLTDVLAVVTGASRGIGLAITRTLVEEGAIVVAGARHAGDELRALADGGRVHPVEVDLSTQAGATDLAAAAEKFGDTRILVNNVGKVTPRLTGFLDVTDDDWLGTLTLDLLAAIRTTRAVLPAMLGAGQGSIVMISSVNATLADPAVIDYSAAKAALTNTAKSLSKQLGPNGIRVNTISPGPVATDLWLGDTGVAHAIAHATGGDADAVARSAAAASVTGRFTRPDEIADLAAFLASERAANITGSDFVIDGGLLTTT
ncbi:SDR family oxidoreductase [Nocardia tengchongensis]|uniref:3-oxoacyl-[acyl-carrier-protein] reductase MabA n=1 Tax=Nocardia tengchongensis TaxID=2055889 RepID=A0ABX8CHE0_9NOCA|nr:SDR family oxidoreductase [Nocardia tengchongensis]QVI18706.1 SDR family oxidoreductase [Nocardia tengchongensis]